MSRIHEALKKAEQERANVHGTGRSGGDVAPRSAVLHRLSGRGTRRAADSNAGCASSGERITAAVRAIICGSTICGRAARIRSGILTRT